METTAKDNIVDIEEYAQREEKPPVSKCYRIKINGEKYLVHARYVTGREILELAGLNPPETYTLRVKRRGQRPEKIGLDDKVDLTEKGVEKFKALPRDQTEGLDLRRQCELPIEDQRFLDDYGLPWETIADGSPWVLIHEFPVPKGYTQDKVTVAIRIESGYPNSVLDMAYFSPALQRVDGKAINATQHIQRLDGKGYQRWSRHRTSQNPWIPSVDNLGTHMILVEEWLVREFE